MDHCHRNAIFEEEEERKFCFLVVIYSEISSIPIGDTESDIFRIHFPWLQY